MQLPRFRNASVQTTALLYVLIIILGLFAVRLFYLQIIRHDYYANEAQQSQVSKLTILPDRGKILAMDGTNTVPLVLNETVYTVFADPQELTRKDDVVAAIKKIAGGTLVDGFEPRLDSKILRYVPMAKEVTRTQAIKLQNMKLAGVGLQKGSRRVYPEGQLGSQMLGYVDNNGIGRYGIEGYLNKDLTGKSGVLQTVTDVRQIPLTIGQDDASTPAKNGEDLVLSVDRNIQQETEQVLRDGLIKAKATTGCAVVMDPNTGRILAMANLPTYDAAKYGDYSDYGLFQNGIVSDPFEVGSVMKVLSMGAGLDSGAVTPNSSYNNTGKVDIDGSIIRNVEEDPIFPNTTMTDVLRYSLNTGVVWVLQQMGGGSVNQTARQKLYDYYNGHYRFGKLTGIEQANESEGTIIGANQGVGRNVRYANMMFGQGMDITMIQMVAAFSAAMNGGTYYQPTMVKGIMADDNTIKIQAPKVVANNVLTPANSQALRELTYQGRHQGFFGTADPAGYKVGGKTGTSQIIDPKTGKYSDNNSIGTYIGYGGTDTPQYVIMVRVQDSKLASGYAGTVAAGPIFNTLSNWMLNYLEIPPKS